MLFICSTCISPLFLLLSAVESKKRREVFGSDHIHTPTEWIACPLRFVLGLFMLICSMTKSSYYLQWWQVMRKKIEENGCYIRHFHPSLRKWWRGNRDGSFWIVRMEVSICRKDHRLIVSVLCVRFIWLLAFSTMDSSPRRQRHYRGFPAENTMCLCTFLDPEEMWYCLSKAKKFHSLVEWAGLFSTPTDLYVSVTLLTIFAPS